MQDEGLDMNSARFGVSGCQLSVAVAVGVAGKKRVARPHPTCVAGVADISTPFLDICHNKLLALLLLTPVFEMFCIRLSQEKGGSRETCKGNLQPADLHTCAPRQQHMRLRANRPWQTVESDAGLQGLPEAHRGIVHACTRAPRQQHMQDEGLGINSA